MDQLSLKSKNTPLADSITIIVMLLMSIGTVFVFSAGVDITQDLNLTQFYNFPGLRQILFFPIAVALMLIFSQINYKKLNFDKGLLRSPLCYLLALTTILLIIVLIPKIGTEINYARRWLRIPIGHIKISFQPSELAKWTLLFFLAAFCEKFSDQLNKYFKTFIPLCLTIAFIAGLILVEDFGTAALVILLSFLILIIAGAKPIHMLSLLPFGLAAFALALKSSPARIARITAFLNPHKWADSANYQANQSLIAIGSGGIFGKGLGKGICKYGHLPEDTTDFIFSIIAEELGFIGTAAVIILFIAFVWIGILIICRCKDRFGQLLAAGIVMAISIQAALNIGVVTVVLPTKGIPLPFISGGGTSLLLTAAAVGILINIAKQSEKKLTLEDA